MAFSRSVLGESGCGFDDSINEYMFTMAVITDLFPSNMRFTRDPALEDRAILLVCNLSTGFDCSQ